MQCEHHDRVNFCTAKVRLRECVVTRLGDAILNLLKKPSAHGQVGKPLSKVNCQK